MHPAIIGQLAADHIREMHAKAQHERQTRPAARDARRWTIAADQRGRGRLSRGQADENALRGNLVQDGGSRIRRVQ